MVQHTSDQPVLVWSGPVRPWVQSGSILTFSWFSAKVYLYVFSPILVLGFGGDFFVQVRNGFFPWDRGFYE